MSSETSSDKNVPADVAKLEPKELADFRQTVEWLGDQIESDRSFWLPKKAEALGVEASELRSAVMRVLSERDAAIKKEQDRIRSEHHKKQMELALQVTAQRLEADRKKAEAAAQQREQQIEIDRLRIEKMTKQEAEAKERKDEKAKRDKERKDEKDAKAKAKEKTKAITEIVRLPRDERADRIAELAESCGEEVAVMQQECAAIVESRTPPEWDVAAWPEPVTAVELLEALIVKINKHAIVQPYQALAIALWIMMAWVHEVAADVSPYLLITAPDKDSGKTTLGLDVVGRLVPRPFSMAEPNATHIFRVADEYKPCCISDDVDTLFKRKPELASIYKIGWKRGQKVPRMDHGFMRHFDPFCPKVCTMIGTNIPEALLSRFVLIKMKPKLKTETIAKAKRDDDEFKELRRKLKRWSDDNAAALKDAPEATDFSVNREYDNWHLQLAIADLAGTAWRQKALEAAELLTRTMRKPSWRQMLVAEFRAAAKEGYKNITSGKFYKTRITANPLSDWFGYNHGTKVITQYQVGYLARQLGLDPVLLGTRRVRGWRLDGEDFSDVFARYPEDPLILSSGGEPKKRKRKERRRGSRRARRAFR